jgi:carbonic anhydrase/acetyltransferase-like protein (isoleucine patch superfamily)
MGAIILNGATIGENSIVGAGALVTEGVEIPANSVAFGSPARPRRAMAERDVEGVTNNARVYVERAREALEDEG